MAINKELTVELKNNEIHISLGLETLAFAVQYADFLGDYAIDKENGTYKKFGESVLRYLEKEEEDGTTPIHRMLDSVVEEALEQGEEGFLEVEN